MKYETSIIEINGSFYMRLPKPFRQHMKINKAGRGFIQDETGSKGEYCSFWKK